MAEAPASRNREATDHGRAGWPPRRPAGCTWGMPGRS